LQEFEDTGLVSGFIMTKKRRVLDPRTFRQSHYLFDGQEITRLTANSVTLKFMPLGAYPPQIERILYAAYKSPTNNGIPIGYSMTRGGKDYVTGMNQEGERADVLVTTKIARVTVGPQTFVVPKGYKLVKSVGHVVAGSTARDESADFQNLFENPKPLQSKALNKSR
jgi:hypothetical protein